MGKKCDLTQNEKQEIIKLLHCGNDTLKISKVLKRDHRTIQAFCNEGRKCRKKRNQPTFNKLTDRDLRKIKTEVKKAPYSTSRSIFENAGLPKMSRTTRCKALKSIGKVKKMTKRPLLTEKHKENRVKWATEYLKTNFENVLFTDECRATLDGPDGWAKGWVVDGQSTTTRISRQQGGGGVMFWAGIMGSSLLGPFRVDDGVKLNSEGYCAFLNEHFLTWFKSQRPQFRNKLVFMHDNAPSHASNHTKQWLSEQGLRNEKLMVWPPNSPDLNPIENFWSIVKQKVYKNGRQYSSKDGLWAAIKVAC